MLIYALLRKSVKQPHNMGCGLPRPEKPEDPLCAHCRKQPGERVYYGSKYCDECYDQLQGGHRAKEDQFERQLAKLRGENVEDGNIAQPEEGRSYDKPKKKKDSKREKGKKKGKGKEKAQEETVEEEVEEAEEEQQKSQPISQQPLNQRKPPPQPPKKLKKLPPVPPPKMVKGS